MFPFGAETGNPPGLSIGDVGKDVACLLLLVSLGPMKATGTSMELSVGEVGNKVAFLRLFASFGSVDGIGMSLE